ncbi:dehydratase [Orrella sp. NBD-18]|uniref:Dehydratase n=1 Tax=Sheuella amnicola TaxID=2707330 RepID=A0A6B2QVE2_9BURK|nr:MaoC/PaaZ C-terminal domain-containing protein [Sheuella amnicola]NDY81618.1 dehydratase [Sheuella amnicola]HBI83752.1 dehydratase [Alcaligenaceae bacterium]
MNFLQKYYDEIEVGDSYRSRGRTITEADIVQWCSYTGDWYVLHSNEHYAAQTRFGQRIAPGLLVLAYAAGLGVPPDAPSIVANYGTDRLRFVAPVFIGDTIHLRSAVVEKTTKREGRDGVLKLDWNVHNQDGTLVMSSDLQILMSFSGAAK